MKIAKKALQINTSYYLKKRYNYLGEKFQSEIAPPFLVLSNHCISPLMIANSFDFPITFITDRPQKQSFVRVIQSEKNKLANYENILSEIKQGRSVCLCTQEPYLANPQKFSLDVVNTAKLLQIPLLIYNIIGGYFTQPYWTKSVRKGYARGYVKKIILRSEYEQLEDENFLEIINQSVDINDYSEEELKGYKYKGKHLAEHLEQAMYLCLRCKNFSTLVSASKEIFCVHCGIKMTYDEDCRLSGEYNMTLSEYDKEQTEQLENKVFSSDAITSDEVEIENKRTKLVAYADCFVLEDEPSTQLPFESINKMEVISKKLIITTEKSFILQGDSRFSALKYLRIFEKQKNNSV